MHGWLGELGVMQEYARDHKISMKITVNRGLEELLRTATEKTNL